MLSWENRRFLLGLLIVKLHFFNLDSDSDFWCNIIVGLLKSWFDPYIASFLFFFSKCVGDSLLIQAETGGYL